MSWKAELTAWEYKFQRSLDGIMDNPLNVCNEQTKPVFPSEAQPSIKRLAADIRYFITQARHKVGLQVQGIVQQEWDGSVESNVKPITPKEAGSKSRESIPEPVIKAFNDLIVLNWYNGEAVVMQKDVVAQAKPLIAGRWDNDWLNVEELYEEAGWDVEYDKPGYNETYEPKFTFRQRG